MHSPQRHRGPKLAQRNARRYHMHSLRHWTFDIQFSPTTQYLAILIIDLLLPSLRHWKFDIQSSPTTQYLAILIIDLLLHSLRHWKFDIGHSIFKFSPSELNSSPSYRC